jgi:hypothetical protein
VPAQSLQTDAFVLLKRPAADSFQSFTVFSVAHGLLFVLQRTPKNPTRRGGSPAKTTSTSVALDLFDEADLQLESSNQGRTWFVKEVRLITRHVGIGRSYEALRDASALASLVARNAVDEESRGPVAGLLRTAFAAFGAAERPDIVYFKSVYRFARDEGYPVKEQWFPSLPPADRADVATLLSRPLAEQNATAAAVSRLQRRLEEYLRGHTEILLE